MVGKGSGAKAVLCPVGSNVSLKGSRKEELDGLKGLERFRL